LLVDARSLEDDARRSMAMEAVWAASAAFDADDVEGCSKGRAFAENVSSAIRDTPEWRRLSLKTKLGPRLWRAVGAVVRRVRAEGTPVSRSR